MNRILKEVIFIAVILVGWYLAFSFISWDIEWITNGSYLERMLYIILTLYIYDSDKIRKIKY